MKRAHKRLDVWQESMSLATDVYKLTELFPRSEVYGLVSQVRRAAVSVPSNIAEGAARYSDKEFSQFLNIAGGSLSELDTQIEISLNLGYLTEEKSQKIDHRISSISAKLAGLINNVRKRL